MEEYEYTTEIAERHLKWLTADEGKMFWRWLDLMITQSVEGSGKFLGAHEMSDIIKANKMKATQQTYGWVSQYRERLIEVLKDKKSDGEQLTSIEDL
jgi:hypothetical protein